MSMRRRKFLGVLAAGAAMASSRVLGASLGRPQEHEPPVGQVAQGPVAQGPVQATPLTCTKTELGQATETSAVTIPSGSSTNVTTKNPPATKTGQSYHTAIFTNSNQTTMHATGSVPTQVPTTIVFPTTIVAGGSTIETTINLPTTVMTTTSSVTSTWTATSTWTTTSKVIATYTQNGNDVTGTVTWPDIPTTVTVTYSWVRIVTYDCRVGVVNGGKRAGELFARSGTDRIERKFVDFNVGKPVSTPRFDADWSATDLGV